jgi:hypothetical protein
MKNRYWIKLYIGLLHDPRMARLDNTTWRHAIELFLLAGETGDDGNVGSLEDVAWHLRVDEAEMLACLEKLSDMGVMKEEDGSWHVFNFSERQRPSTSTERVREFRQRKKATLFKNEVLEEKDLPDHEEEEEDHLFEEGYEDETHETEMKQDETAAAKRFPSASAYASASVSESVSESASGNYDETNFESKIEKAEDWVLPGGFTEFSMLTPEAMEELRPSLMKHPPQWTADAIREEKRYKATSPGYVKAILDRW